jgi:predicted nucleic-acid-binding protein
LTGLDTNVIVRYLTQDDRVQAAKANDVFERILTEGDRGFVSIVAMVETVRVLERAYGFEPSAVAAAVESLLGTDVVCVQFEQEVFAALVQMKAKTGTFADALVANLGLSAGCSKTVTFDRRSARMAGFAFL